MTGILDQLEARAGKATPGPYIVQWAGEHAYYIYHNDEMELWDSDGHNAAFLSACSPSVILALVRVAKAAYDLRRDHESWDEMNDALTELSVLK